MITRRPPGWACCASAGRLRTSAVCECYRDMTPPSFATSMRASGWAGPPRRPRTTTSRLPTPRLTRLARMTWQFSDEQLMIRETVREAAQDKIAPRSKEVDETAEFPTDWVDLLRDLGLFVIPF